MVQHQAVHWNQYNILVYMSPPSSGLKNKTISCMIPAEEPFFKMGYELFMATQTKWGVGKPYKICLTTATL
jgi:hypothetical protein